MTNQKSELQGIRYREHIDKWEARIVINKQSFCKTFKTSDEAIQWRKSLLESKNSECHLRCEQVFDPWLESLKNDVDISPQTQLKYQNDTKVHITPFFGTMKLKDIDDKIMLDFAINLKRTQTRGCFISSKTITNIIGTLSNFFEFCCSQSYILLNPAKSNSFRQKFNRFVKPKRRQKHTIQIQEKSRNEEDLKKLIRASIEKSPEFGCAVQCAVATGMRLGELSALTWSDFKTSDGVRYTAVINKTRHFLDKVVQHSAKCGSNREIAIPFHLVELMKRWKQKAIEMGYDVEKSDAVFPSVARNQREFSRSLGRLSDSIGIPHTTAHCLRHSYITYLAIHGHNLQEVQKCAGHANVRMTSGYFGASQLGTEPMAETISGLILPFVPTDKLGHWTGIVPEHRTNTCQI